MVIETLHVHYQGPDQIKCIQISYESKSYRH